MLAAAQGWYFVVVPSSFHRGAPIHGLPAIKPCYQPRVNCRRFEKLNPLSRRRPVERRPATTKALQTRPALSRSKRRLYENHVTRHLLIFIFFLSIFSFIISIIVFISAADVKHFFGSKNALIFERYTHMYFLSAVTLYILSHVILDEE